MCGRLLTDPERVTAFHALSREEKHVALEWVRDHEGPTFDSAMAYLGRLQTLNSMLRKDAR